MNHTPLVLLGVVLVAATLLISALAVAPALAAGHYNNNDKRDKNDKKDRYGDSSATITKQANKQKQILSGFITTGAQDADNCIAVLNDANACRQQGQEVTPPGPPPSTVGCPSNTVYDAHLTQDLGEFPSGSEVCLQKTGENPDSSIVPTGSTTATPQSVRADQSDAGRCSQGSTALVDTGNPPDGPAFALGQIICITLT